MLIRFYYYKMKQNDFILFFYNVFLLLVPISQMKITNWKNVTHIANWLITSIIISTCCIVFVIVIWYLSTDWYTNNKWWKNTQTKKQSSEQKSPWNSSQWDGSNWSSNSSSNAGINTTTKPMDWTNDIDGLLGNIQKSSQEQLSVWQKRNTDSTFLPQTIMPRYFKTFNWDNYSMQK